MISKTKLKNIYRNTKYAAPGMLNIQCLASSKQLPDIQRSRKVSLNMKRKNQSVETCKFNMDD